jgi:membrane protein implicated in regulation of membrane protease activity
MIWMMLIMALPVLGLGLFFVLPLTAAVPLYLVLLSVSGAYHWLMMRALRLPPQVGPEKMIGSVVTVRKWKGNAGQVIWESEIWRAETAGGTVPASGDKVVIEGLSGLILSVRPIDKPRAERHSAERTCRAETTPGVERREYLQ